MALFIKGIALPLAPQKSEKAASKQASFRNMTDEHQAIAESFLMADYSIDDLTKKVCEEWKYFPHVKPASVRRMLYRYKNTYLRTKQMKIAAKHATPTELAITVAKLNKLEERLEPVLAIESLVATQVARMAVAQEFEKNSKMPLDIVSKEVKLTADLLFKLADLHLELGMLKRVPKKLNVSQVDITDEERQYMQNAALSDAKANMVMDIMRGLSKAGSLEGEVVGQTSAG